jgi:hypothetical protein
VAIRRHPLIYTEERRKMSRRRREKGLSRKRLQGGGDESREGERERE